MPLHNSFVHEGIRVDRKRPVSVFTNFYYRHNYLPDLLNFLSEFFVLSCYKMENIKIFRCEIYRHEPTDSTTHLKFSVCADQTRISLLCYQGETRIILSAEFPLVQSA